MTIHIACPHCRQPLRIPAQTGGATIQCPHCHGLARLPGAPAPAPPEPAPPAAPRDPTLNPWAGITALVVGLVGLVFACVPMCAAPLCLAAVVFGGIGLAYYQGGRGMAIAGLVLGVCGLVLTIVVTNVVLALSPPAVPAAPNSTSQSRPPWASVGPFQGSGRMIDMPTQGALADARDAGLCCVTPLA